MTEAHPTDVELFSYAEQELSPGDTERVASHVAACAVCAGSVRDLEAGREALRAAPLLELSRARRSAMLERLPRQERPRTPLLGRRALAVLAPVAAAAALAAVVVETRGDGAPAPDREASAPARMGDQRTRTAPQAEGVQNAPTMAALPPLRFVAGPPAAVVAQLRREGLNARAAQGGVVVRGAGAAAVRRALAGRARGGVPVYVVTKP